jgi:ribonuclease P protein component
LSNQTHLRTSGEFRQAYAQGKRYDGRLMTIFIRPNNLPYHRFGITASRKATGHAVNRNRAKRLLREVFRLSSPTLDTLHLKYDWVFNARRVLLETKMQTPYDEFTAMLARVARDEQRGLTACGN